MSENPQDAYEILNPITTIGRTGAFAAQHKAMERPVVFYRISLYVSDPEVMQKTAMEEVLRWSNMKFDGLVEIIDAWEYQHSVCFVTPLVQGTTLQEMISNPEDIELIEALRIAQEILLMMKVAHEQNTHMGCIHEQNFTLVEKDWLNLNRSPVAYVFRDRIGEEEEEQSKKKGDLFQRDIGDWGRLIGKLVTQNENFMTETEVQKLAGGGVFQGLLRESQTPVPEELETLVGKALISSYFPERGFQNIQKVLSAFEREKPLA